MERYLVFMGSIYYPSGGFEDFAGDFSTEKEAVNKAKSMDYDFSEWAHVYDTRDRKILLKIYTDDD